MRIRLIWERMRLLALSKGGTASLILPSFFLALSFSCRFRLLSSARAYLASLKAIISLRSSSVK